MNSLVMNNINKVSRRAVLAFAMLIGISATVLANTNVEARMTRLEATELISAIIEDLQIEAVESEFVFDENGIFEEVNPVQIIKVYDKNDELLLEAPISKIQQTKNKHLRRLLNASDFLTEYGNSKYYRLDI